MHQVGVETVSHCEAGNGGMRLRAFGEKLYQVPGVFTVERHIRGK